MNVTILSNRDLPSLFALNLLLPKLVADHRIQIFLSTRVGRSETMLPELRELESFEQSFLGQGPEANPQEPRPAVALRSFDELGSLAGCSVPTLNAINSEAGMETLRKASPDLILSIRYGVILRRRVLSIPRHGVLNLHSGLLPAYRGVMATFRALLHGDDEVGATLHYIRDEGIDTGDVIEEVRIPADGARSYLWNVLKLYPPGCAAMLRAVAEIQAGGNAETRPQAPGGAYYSFPSAKDLKAFEDRGHRIFDGGERADMLALIAGSLGARP